MKVGLLPLGLGAVDIFLGVANLLIPEAVNQIIGWAALTVGISLIWWWAVNR